MLPLGSMSTRCPGRAYTLPNLPTTGTGSCTNSHNLCQKLCHAPITHIEQCLPSLCVSLCCACSFACHGQKPKLCFACAGSADASAYPVIDHMPGVRDFGFILLGKSPVARPGGAHSVDLQGEPGEEVSNVIGCQHSHHSSQRMPCIGATQCLR